MRKRLEKIAKDLQDYRINLIKETKFIQGVRVKN